MRNLPSIGIRVRNVIALAGICLAALGGCATAPGMSAAEWTILEMKDVKRIAEIRESISDLRPAFRDVLILRFEMRGEGISPTRVDVTSVGPAIVSAVKDGAPAARTTFGFDEKRERLTMLTQDVPQRRAFHREIPVAQLTEGRSFLFPVVLESGALTERSFTVQQLIVR